MCVCVCVYVCMCVCVCVCERVCVLPLALNRADHTTMTQRNAITRLISETPLPRRLSHTGEITPVRVKVMSVVSVIETTLPRMPTSIHGSDHTCSI